MPERSIQLKWTSYQDDMRSLFCKLLQSEDLSDVLITNGSKSIKCHRVILSSACKNFYDLLKTHAGDVVIYLGSVHTSDMTSLVNFMYSGEVDVAQGRLSAFLTLARQWGVRGLCQSTDADADVDVEADAEQQLTELGHGGRAGARSEGRRTRPDSASPPDESYRGCPPPAPAPAPAADVGNWQARALAQPDGSDSSSEDEAGAGPAAMSTAVLSVLRPSAGKQRKKHTASLSPSTAVGPVEKPTKSAAKAVKVRSSKVSKITTKTAPTLHNLPDMYACPHCPRVFVKPHYFSRHKAKEHGDRTPMEKNRLQLEPGGVSVDSGLLKLRLPVAKKKTTKRLERAAEAVAAADAAVAVEAVEAQVEADSSARGTRVIDSPLASSASAPPRKPWPPRPSKVVFDQEGRPWPSPARPGNSSPRPLPPRAGPPGPQPSPLQPSRIVFDSEGRPSAPPAAPLAQSEDRKPVGIATHVRAGPWLAPSRPPGESRQDQRERGGRSEPYRRERSWDRENTQREHGWRHSPGGRPDRADGGKDSGDGRRDSADGLRDGGSGVPSSEAKRRRVGSAALERSEGGTGSRWGEAVTWLVDQTPIPRIFGGGGYTPGRSEDDDVILDREGVWPPRGGGLSRGRYHPPCRRSPGLGKGHRLLDGSGPRHGQRGRARGGPGRGGTKLRVRQDLQTFSGYR
ncbi:uncharacterized protein LOC119110355 isoform X2 [Pollicipes pollicipes]|nr:uncharacterized protein LOC119110355 isoform X2 [Pollicipes pollicipes]XP_037090034.1 uncharacterized protein LOC119110355 isoform X2 [Pollicipes pollicipes]XP_037090035.1 uncharacterized protein LOC119110355 isoform X2 [Pollicipes pollicipes]XP_037090036.1 uncharacterized protein LOC119110355 isoform X2 [Pollicipes pollicipes]XP_037090038.1 uncharacterized protein LOC119110355 isoform X2 [Pollicipes pollicipes]XP_037090039.1 uncharacterized protein LOC119110355 isoform X2 [Pollicipes polli